MDISGNTKAMQRLRADVERCKHVLSTVQTAALEVDGLHEVCPAALFAGSIHIM